MPGHFLVERLGHQQQTAPGRGLLGAERRGRPPDLRARLFRGVLDGVLRGGAGRSHRQLPQPDRRAVPKQGEQALQELIGERFLHRDRGHDRIGQQPGLVIAVRPR